MSAIYSMAALLIVCIVFFFVLAEQKRNSDKAMELLELQNEQLRTLLSAMAKQSAEEREQLLDRLQSENFAQFKAYNGEAPVKSSKPSNFLKQSIDEAAQRFQHESVQL